MNLIEKLEGMRKFAVEHYNPMAASGAITVIDELISWHNKQSHIQGVMQGCQCKDRIGETTVWCCNQCGLPCEDGWLPIHKPVRQPTVASEGQGEANKCADFWCMAEMHGQQKCYAVCNLCKGYGG